jgi:hypothetical protein
VQDLAGIPAEDIVCLESALGVDADAAVCGLAEFEVILPLGHGGAPALKGVFAPGVGAGCGDEVGSADTFVGFGADGAEVLWFSWWPAGAGWECGGVLVVSELGRVEYVVVDVLRRLFTSPRRGDKYVDAV